MERKIAMIVLGLIALAAAIVVGGGPVYMGWINP